jgi:hypothetical protein
LIFVEFSSRIPDFLSIFPDFSPIPSEILREFATFRDGYRVFLISSCDSSPVFQISSRFSSISPDLGLVGLEEIGEEIVVERLSGDHLRENFREISSDDSIFRFLVRRAIPDLLANFVEVALAGGGHSEVPASFVAKFDNSCDGSNFGERNPSFHVLFEISVLGKFWFATNVTNRNFVFRHLFRIDFLLASRVLKFIPPRVDFFLASRVLNLFRHNSISSFLQDKFGFRFLGFEIPLGLEEKQNSDFQDFQDFQDFRNFGRKMKNRKNKF